MSQVPLNFPLKGVSEVPPFGAPLSTIAPDALNVRPFDVTEGRVRGGKRPGSTRYIPTAVNGSNAIQRLTQGNVATAPIPAVYSAPAESPMDSAALLRWHPGGNYVAVYGSNSPYIQVYAWSQVSGYGAKVADPATSVGGAALDAQWSPSGDFLAVTSATTLSIYAWTGTGFGARLDFENASFGGCIAWNPAGTYIVASLAASPWVKGWSWSGSAFGASISNPGTTVGAKPQKLVWHPGGLSVGFVFDTSPYVAAYAWTGTAWGARSANPASLPPGECRDIVFSPTGARVAVAHPFDTPFFSVYQYASGFGARDADPVDIPSGTRHAPCTVDIASTADFFTITGDDWPADGTAGDAFISLYEWTEAAGIGARRHHFDVITTFGGGTIDGAAIRPGGNAVGVSLNSGVTTTLTGFFVPFGGSAVSRATYLAAVSGAQVYRSDSPPTVLTPASGTVSVVNTLFMAAFAGPPSPDDSSPANVHPHVYFADGTNYNKLDLVTNTISAWTASSPGTMPSSCRIGALWRGRAVLSGSENDPHNWLMSEVNNPRGWDYGATPSATMAVAGNNSDAGECDDIIKCLAPFNDDVLIFGGDHTIEAMSGDPADGGRRDHVSYAIGVVGADAWTLAPDGTMYLFATNGLNRLTKNGIPELVSGGRIDKTFSSVDFTTSRVLLAWDRDRQGCHIFITPVVQSATAPKHWWYDLRTDSLLPQQWPAATGPTAVCVFDGDAPGDRALLLGGFDSIIRRESDAEPDDDTTVADTPVAVTSFVDLGIVVPSGVMKQSILQDWQMVLGSESGSVTAEIYAADTPELAKKATTPRAARTLKGGRNKHGKQPVTANAFRFRLRHATLGETWSMESGEATFAPAGPVPGGR